MVRRLHNHISVWTMALLLLAATPTRGQEAGAGGGDGFGAFWSRFRDAVARDSEPEIRNLTRLPFLYEGEPHDAERCQ